MLKVMQCTSHIKIMVPTEGGKHISGSNSSGLGLQLDLISLERSGRQKSVEILERGDDKTKSCQRC